MGLLHYIKASDINCNFCFLEVSRSDNHAPFMDIRISEDRKLSFVIYIQEEETSLSPQEWMEIYEKATTFYEMELANEDAFNEWNT